jgi:hypothetical protein
MSSNTISGLKNESHTHVILDLLTDLSQMSYLIRCHVQKELLYLQKILFNWSAVNVTIIDKFYIFYNTIRSYLALSRSRSNVASD